MIYKNMPESEYFGRSEISKSELDLFNKSPATYIWAKQYQTSSVTTEFSLMFGKQFHCAVLEPERFDNLYICGTDLPRNTKIGKEAHAELVKIADERGAKVIPRDDYMKIMAMRKSLHCHPEASKLLNGFESEVSYTWTNEETGLDCRCRVDGRNLESGIVFDIKTTSNIDKFYYSVIDYRYYVQAPMYLDGINANANGIMADKFYFVVIGTSLQLGRYPIRVIELDEHALDTGRVEYKNNLRYLKHCRENDEWNGVETMSIGD